MKRVLKEWGGSICLTLVIAGSAALCVAVGIYTTR